MDGTTNEVEVYSCGTTSYINGMTSLGTVVGTDGLFSKHFVLPS